MSTNLQTVIARNQDFSIIHFSFLNRNLRGMNYNEAIRYLTNIIDLKVTANRTFIGRRVSGDHRHPKYPQKAARVLRETLRLLITRIQADTPNLNLNRVMIHSMLANRRPIVYRPYYRAMRGLDFMRRMSYDLHISVLILPNPN